MAVCDDNSLVIVGKIGVRTTLTKYDLITRKKMDSVFIDDGAKSVSEVSLAGKPCIAVSYGEYSDLQTSGYG